STHIVGISANSESGLIAAGTQSQVEISAAEVSDGKVILNHSERGRVLGGATPLFSADSKQLAVAFTGPSEGQTLVLDIPARGMVRPRNIGAEHFFFRGGDPM